MRPTRNRDKNMNYRIIDIKESFINMNAALVAFNIAQHYFIGEGFLTTSYVNIECGSIQLTVHFDLPKYPSIPQVLKYSRKEILSDLYYSEISKRTSYIRYMTLYFKY